MQIKWMSVPALALCLASTGALKAHACPAQPGSGFAQYQEHPDRWNEPPDSYNDAQRRGFHEGMEAARQDMQEGRRVDADHHDAYRHPPVEGDLRNAYREGFREGYHRAMDHMRNEGPHF